MKPLITVKETLTWLSICQPAEPTSKSKRIARIVFSMLIFTGNICGIIIHLAHIFKIGLRDPEGSIFSFMGSVGYIGATYILATAFIFRYRIMIIFEQLSNIYDTCKLWKNYRNVNHFYSRTFYFSTH